MTAHPDLETARGDGRGADQLFAGSGELRALCRALDWAATPLGPVEEWPASLRTAAGLVLAAPTAMIVLWGADLVQAYNDGYREVMGVKHPAGLGQPTRECWPEVWDFNAPLYAGVMQRGETFTFTDQRLVLERHGHPEEAFFTLTFSPVPDDAGAVGGVLVTVFETTAQVRGLLSEAERARLAAAMQAERAGLLKPLLEALPEVRGQGFDLLLDRVLETGEPVVAREIPVQLERAPGAPPEDRVIALAYLPLVGAEGARVGVVAHGADVTDYVLARRELERLHAERDAVRRVELEAARDITDRKRAEAERERLLAEAEAARAAADLGRRQLDAVLEQLPVGVVVAEAPSVGSTFTVTLPAAG